MSATKTQYQDYIIPIVIGTDCQLFLQAQFKALALLIKISKLFI